MYPSVQGEFRPSLRLYDRVQGSKDLPLTFDTMSYEDGDTMAYEPDDWFFWNWQKRIQLTVQPNQVPSPQTNFKFLINHTFPELIGKTQDEIRFTTVDNILLDYEIKNFLNINGSIIAFMNLPTISNGDIINMYYDNPTAIDAQNIFALWSDYESVYHLNQNPSGPNTILDSTINQNHGSPDGTSLDNGTIGNGQNFNASNDDKITFPPCDLSFDFTISIWYKTTQTSISDILAITVGNDHGILIENQLFGVLRFLMRNPVGNTGGVDVFSQAGFNDGEFHLAHCVFDSISNTQKLYVDGILENSETNNQALMSAINECTLGQISPISDSRSFNGVLDEFRVARRVLSDDYITAEFNNQLTPETFYNRSTEQLRPDESTLDIMEYN